MPVVSASGVGRVHTRTPRPPAIRPRPFAIRSLPVVSGPRILLLVIAAIVALVWLALADDPQGDVRRGLAESNLALVAVEAELLAMEPAYQLLTRRGVMLDLKAEHDELRSRVAALRARRLRLADDTDLPRQDVLPAFRAVADEAFEALAFAQSLGRRVEARQAFILESSPLLRDARALRDALMARPISDALSRQTVESLAGRFAELETHAKRTDTLLQQSPEQGAIMAAATLNGLRDFLAEAAALQDRLDAGP